MKIKSIKTYIVDKSTSEDGWTDIKPFIFVKVETDEGIHGWGEAYVLSHQEKSIAQLVGEIGEHLVDTNPLSVRRFVSRAFSDIAEKRYGLSFFCAMSALELALWDIAGKARSLPAYELLGGACHEQIRLYANFWSNRNPPTGEVVDKALEMKEKGFNAVKIYPFQCPTLALAEDRVRRVRDAIGPDMELMIDLSGHDDVSRSLQAAERFAQYEPYWIEEPVASHDIENLTHITRSTSMRIVTGERLAGKFAFKEILERKAANVLNPDIAGCGGILTFLDIASMAEAFGVEISPHNYNSMSVAHAAMLQAAALTPSCRFSEYFPYFQPGSNKILVDAPTVENGFAALPPQPGLGVELDEVALKALARESS